MVKKQSGKGGNPGVIPLGDRVLIREIPKEDKKTAGGIIIPDTVKTDRSSKRGAVVAVGRGRHEDGALVPPEVKEGDVVLFGWGDEISIEGEEFFLVKESEVYAIIK